jgi:hypothetical protein
MLLSGAAGKPEAGASATEQSMHIASGRAWLFPAGPKTAGGSSVHVLLSAAWEPIPPPPDAELPEDAAGDASELVAPLRELERRTAKLLEEKLVEWKGGNEAALPDLARWLERETGIKVTYDTTSPIGAESIICPTVHGRLPAVQFLDALVGPIEWCGIHGVIGIGQRGLAVAARRRDLTLPSIEDFSSPEDRDAFASLSKPVELEVKEGMKYRDLFVSIGRATGVRWMASGSFGDSVIEFPGYLPGGAVPAALVLHEVRPAIWWYIDRGVVVYHG